jgi:hypothetical protein
MVDTINSQTTHRIHRMRHPITASRAPSLASARHRLRAPRGVVADDQARNRRSPWPVPRGVLTIKAALWLAALLVAV